MDVGSITPATRDLLQALNTRKKSLALVALLDDDRPEDEAARLDEVGVPALAFAEAGQAMQRAARSTKSLPSLCLAPLRERQACLEARWFGADGVCIDASLSPEAWASVATDARSTRMMALAAVGSAAEIAAAIAAGARGLRLRVEAAAGDVAAARAVEGMIVGVPRGTLLVVEARGADAALLRALRGVADAAVVPAALHRDAGFAALLAELED